MHIRIGGGLVKALDRAQRLECEAVQLFSGNPNAWARTPLDPDAAALFTARAADLNIHPIVLHTPYLVNLASPDDDIWGKSAVVLADAVKRAPLISAGYIVTHIGSHKGAGYEAGLERIEKAVRYALKAGISTQDRSDPSILSLSKDEGRSGRSVCDEGPVIALEMGSGSGNSIGSRFEQMEDILSRLTDVSDRVGICIDTAHLWGAGYDISTEQGVNSMFDLLKRHVGFERLKVVHLNDTQMPLDSRRDRHYHIGQGHIGREGFRAILNYPGTADLPGIIETPAEDDLTPDSENLAVLRSLRS